MRVTILAIAGGAQRHHREEEAQKNTWANNPRGIFDIYWVHGNPDQPEPVLESDRKLSVPVVEDYSNLLMKRIQSLRWAINNSPAEFYILTNCSGYIDLPTLEELITRMPSSNIYTGPAGNGFTKGSELNELGKYYIGGGFIIVSANVAQKLSEMNPEKFTGISDDLAIGLWLHKKDFLPTPLRFCNLSYGEYLSRNAYTRVRHLRKPEVTIKRMYEVHGFYANGRYTVQSKIREVWRLLNEALPHQFSLRRAAYEIRILNSRRN